MAFCQVQQATGVKDGLHPLVSVRRHILNKTVNFCTAWNFLCREPLAPAGLNGVTLCGSANQTAQPGQKGPLGRLTLVWTRRLHLHQQPSPGRVSCWTAALCPPHLPLPAAIGPFPDCNSPLLEIDLYKLHPQS